MYAGSWPSDAIAIRAVPPRQRSDGQVSLRVRKLGRGTRVAALAEIGPSRVRFPRDAGGALQGILLNTAGGVACGDRFGVEVAVEAGAELVLSTVAAERIYRSDGSSAELRVALDLAEGAGLDWLPQETILYDGARLRRRLEVDLAPSARFLAAESVVFGRAAAGEVMRSGLFEDARRIRRAGRLIHAETQRLSGAVAERLDRAAVGGGARALGTVVYVAPDAEARLDEARVILGSAACLAGASAWNGFLLVRLLAEGAQPLRRALIDFLEAFRGASLPRVWRS